MCYEAAHPAVVLDEPSVVFLSTTSAYLHGLATLISTNWVYNGHLSDLPLLLSTFAGCSGRQTQQQSSLRGVRKHIKRACEASRWLCAVHTVVWQPRLLGDSGMHRCA